MIQPGVYNIRLQRRADYSVLLSFKDSNNTAINLTGWNAYAQIWDPARTTKHADFTIDYVDRTNGQLRLSLTYSTTALLPSESVYDVLLVNTTGQREYYLQGTVQADEGYTTPS